MATTAITKTYLKLVVLLVLFPMQFATAASPTQFYRIHAADLFSVSQQLSAQTGLSIVLAPSLGNQQRALQLMGNFALSDLLNQIAAHFQIEIRQVSAGLVIDAKVAKPMPKMTTASVLTPPPKVTPANLPIEQIAVKGSYSNSLHTASNLKRFSDNIIDAIVAEDIGKFPAHNIAEALQRITGVAIIRDRGEGVYVRVRGLGSNFQITSLNGNALAVNENVRSSGQYGRQFRFDTLPTELISSVSVIKSPNVTLDEGAIGATININTFKPFELAKTKLTVSAQANHSELAHKTRPRLAALANWVNAEQTFGILLATTLSKRSVRQDRALNFGWLKTPSELLPADQHSPLITPAGIRPTLEQEERQRLGASSELQWQVNSALQLSASAFYIDQQIAYQEYSYSADYQLDKLEPSSLLFRNNALVAGATTQGSAQIGYENSGIADRNLALNLGAEWNLADWQIQSSLFYATANSYTAEPIRRIRLRNEENIAFAFRFPQVKQHRVPDLNYRNTDLMNTALWPGRRLEWRHINAEDRELKSNVSLVHALTQPHFSQLHLGLQYRQRQRDYQRRDLIFSEGIAGQLFSADYFQTFPVADFLGQASGQLPAQWLVPNPNRFWQNISLQQALLAPLNNDDQLNSYVINEDIISAYAMLKLDSIWLGTPVRGDAGIRFAHTQQQALGAQLNQNQLSPSRYKQDYGAILPAVNLVFNLNEHLLYRLAVAKTITRPDLPDLAPRLTLNSGDLLTAVGGNPQLKPMQAWQYDVSLEWTPDRYNASSLTLFYKDIQRFIQTQKFSFAIQGQDYQFTGKTNGSSAQVSGVELAIQRLYANSFGLFGMQANYTYTHSKARYESNGQRFYGPLEDVAKNSYNLSVLYENTQLAIRLSYTWRDAVVNQIGINSEVTENRSPVGHLDTQLSYQLNTYTTLFIEGLNLTDQAELEFVDGNEFRSYTHFGRSIGLGIKFTF